MLGWSELAKKVDAVYDSVADKEHTLVYCSNYGQAGAINYYSRHKHINAVSKSADYIDWFPPASVEIKNIVMVKDTWDTDTARKRERQFFETVELTGKIENRYAREYGSAIYLLLNANTSISAILHREIAEEKSRR